MLLGAGLGSHRGYGVLRAALGQLMAARFEGTDAPIILDWSERPGPHFDIVFPPELVDAHARPLARYALMNMEHVRKLSHSLDIATYGRACLVARALVPRFELRIAEIAGIAWSAQGVSWSALLRQALASFVRVCAATGGRIVLQGWCGGDFPGVDRLSCHVGMATDTGIPRFRPRPKAIVIDVRPGGPNRIS